MTSPVGGLKNCLTSTTTTHHYNRPSTTTNKQAANKAMSTLIDPLVGMKDTQDR
ncbi:transposase [Corynebacterium diphtheriae]|nr:transposase-like protein [Corynebacterium diphtheriae INCA 402]APM36720.1 transposase [Corynebacterium diphtheriae]OLN16510.1 transposase [Corynebacterium diphtheriae] [Corynebacterium diphtheriae subsp. lausannense]OLN19746.1 transposase [Corynebacterium diphtheriae]OLO23227.1 transposase [Corynebacterium diphtheriae]